MLATFDAEKLDDRRVVWIGIYPHYRIGSLQTYKTFDLALPGAKSKVLAC